ncbi:unnamed protein product, partial [Phaeothamnion confervicola]
PAPAAPAAATAAGSRSAEEGGGGGGGRPTAADLMAVDEAAAGSTATATAAAPRPARGGDIMDEEEAEFGDDAPAAGGSCGGGDHNHSSPAAAHTAPAPAATASPRRRGGGHGGGGVHGAGYYKENHPEDERYKDAQVLLDGVCVSLVRMLVPFLHDHFNKPCTDHETKEQARMYDAFAVNQLTWPELARQCVMLRILRDQLGMDQTEATGWLRGGARRDPTTQRRDWQVDRATLALLRRRIERRWHGGAYERQQPPSSPLPPHHHHSSPLHHHHSSGPEHGTASATRGAAAAARARPKAELESKQDAEPEVTSEAGQKENGDADGPVHSRVKSEEQKESGGVGGSSGGGGCCGNGSATGVSPVKHESGDGAKKTVTFEAGAPEVHYRPADGDAPAQKGKPPAAPAGAGAAAVGSLSKDGSEHGGAAAAAGGGGGGGGDDNMDDDGASIKTGEDEAGGDASGSDASDNDEDNLESDDAVWATLRRRLDVLAADNGRGEALRRCAAVLRAFAAHPRAAVFGTAVSKDEEPDYAKIVERPVSIETIAEGLESGRYERTAATLGLFVGDNSCGGDGGNGGGGADPTVPFVSDVRLMMEDCWCYNSEAADAWHAAARMSVVAERLLREWVWPAPPARPLPLSAATDGFEPCSGCGGALL